MIPHINEIKRELLLFLYKRPNHKEKMATIIKELAKQFPNLTVSEMQNRYSNSKNRWYNRVQVVRNSLVKEGALYRGEDVRGTWRLTPNGVEIINIRYKAFVTAGILKEKIESDLQDFEAEIERMEQGVEGEKKIRLTSLYERISANRVAAVNIHKTTCLACGFNFGKVYGKLGQDYIEVHHLKPIHTFDAAKPVDPKTEMTVLCANCHRMMHRSKSKVLTLDELKEIIKANRGI